MATRFTKMHGLGNDFVVFDSIHQSLSLTPERIRRIADRRFGIGCDQVLVVESSDQADIDFRYRIYNADGGEVEQCGNGARCFARFVRDKGLTDKDEIAVATSTGVIYPHIQSDFEVTVNMGVPQFEPKDIPFDTAARETTYPLELGDTTVNVGVVSMGNPHAVQVVADVDRAPVAEQGQRFQTHPRFPNQVNAGFMQVVDRSHIRLRVFERGVGETLACGTGACAAVAVGRQMGLLDGRVTVELPGGTLKIHWEGEGQPVFMTGPATTVFEGEIDLDTL
jgi:diaminopimelate epimerase